MPTITRPGPISQPPPSPAPGVVVPKVLANDPKQKVSVSASGQVNISGEANNRGIVRSSVQLEFDGKKVRVDLSGGEHAHDTMKAIAKALPKGYELKQLATRAYGDNAAFRIEKTGAAAPPPTTRVIPKASLNDNGQHVQVNPSGLVVLSGKATNRGTVMGVLNLEFDGLRAKVNMSRDQTPRQTFEKLKSALPDGYELKQQATRAYGDSVAFTIERKATGPTPPPPARSNVKDIDAQFAKAQKASSTAGNKVGVTELRKAVEIAEQGGMSAEDKDALARNWASLFTGAGYRATPAAQKEFAKLQDRLNLPVYPVR